MYYAKQADGYGRTDWVVMGPCSCREHKWVGHCIDVGECLRCEGAEKICRFDGLTRSEAINYAEQLNNGTFVPFNPPRVNQ
jgi:hypothetical protein